MRLPPVVLSTEEYNRLKELDRERPRTERERMRALRAWAILRFATLQTKGAPPPSAELIAQQVRDRAHAEEYATGKRRRNLPVVTARTIARWRDAFVRERLEALDFELPQTARTGKPLPPRIVCWVWRLFDGKKKLKQGQIAKKVGISPAAVSRIRHAPRPDDPMRPRLARAAETRLRCRALLQSRMIEKT